MTAIYNDTDAKAAAWLRELIAHGHIMEGPVDERSIADVRAADLAGYNRVHFFAGIGGWDYALRLAGWPDNRPIWTGSCPCQPFSSAGRRGAEGDERHLWPEFYRLIAECRPPVVFGEQVASKAGRAWLAGVRADLESLGYSVGAADLCAAGVGAPHIRQRLYWVADAQDDGHKQRKLGDQASSQCSTHCGWETGSGRQDASDGCDPGGLADATGPRREARAGDTVGDREPTAGLLAPCGGIAGGLGNAQVRGLAICGDASQQGSGGHALGAGGAGLGGLGHAKLHGPLTAWESGKPSQEGRVCESQGSNCWSRFDLIPCRDGKSRRIESGSFPLAHGVSARVGRLRGYGNAIVPQVAAEFVRAYMETRA